MTGAAQRTPAVRKYLALFRIRFTGSLQYRAAALAGVTTQFAWGIMEILAFSAFHRANPAAFPMELSQTVSYIWLQQAFLALFMMWFFENDIFAAIKDGGLAYDLARPMDLYSRWFCQASATRLAKCLLRCAPILFIAFLLPEPYRISLPHNLGHFGLFILSSALALGVVIAFSMLIYISTIYTLSPIGARLLAGSLADFLSGSIIPLPFFPEGIRQIAELLPFAAMQNTPLRIYSGNITGPELLRTLGLQVFWLVTLTLVGKLWMRQALRRVVVQGG